MTKFLVGLLILLSLLSPKCLAGMTPNLNNAKVAHVVGEINGMTEFSFEMEMRETASVPGDRLILIDSPGGEVYAGQRMIDLVEREKARGVKVVCVVINDASSMAFNLLTHCNERYAANGSRMVVHKIALSSFPDDSRQTARELREEAKEIDQIDQPYRRANAKAMHLTLREYDYYADLETNWSPERLLKHGYLTGVLP